MPLADQKNAAATKKPPDTVLSSSNILGNFKELVVGFADCFDWPAKCRGQCRHSRRDRNNRLHFMEQRGRKELLCIIFSLNHNLQAGWVFFVHIPILSALRHPSFFQWLSRELFLCIYWVKLFLNISVKVSKKPIYISPGWFEIFLLQFLMVSYRKWKYLIHTAT